MGNFIETIIISAKAVQTLSDICDKLRDLANEDNYTEEKEESLIVELVENGREAMKIMPNVLEVYRDLNYGDREEEDQLVVNYRELISIYNVINSIISSDNAYVALKDGANWIKYDKYEDNSEFAFNSVKELILSKIYSMFRIVVDFNKTMLTKDVFNGYLLLNKLKYELAPTLDVADITSLYNTLSGNAGLTNDNQEVKSKIRSIMGLVDGSMPLSRKLNISEKDALESQTLSNFMLAGRIIYMNRFASEVIDKDIELISNVAKNLEMSAVNNNLTLDFEMSDLYPRLYPRSIELLAGNLQLSVDFTTDINDVVDMKDSAIFKNGMIKDINDLEIFKDHFFKYNLITENSTATVYDTVKKADLDQLYFLFTASSIALTIAVGELLSDMDKSMAIKKNRSVNEILNNNESINKIIREKIWNLKDGDDYLVLKDEVLNNSLNNLVARKQLLNKAAVRLVKELSEVLYNSDTAQSYKNCIVIAHRVASIL